MRVGDTVDVVGLADKLSPVVTSVETFGKTMHGAQAGDNTAPLLRGVRHHQVRRGQVLAAPGPPPRAAPLAPQGHDRQ
jgi:elongation factor Tu